jgi:predicted metalloprotease with PDZ domain
MLASTVTRLLRNPGQRRQSLAASSFDAWTKFYKQDENGPNAIVSYYTKGTLVALGLDVELREASGDALNLDHLMRRLWDRFGGQSSGVPERGVEVEVAAMLGQPMEEFFQSYVYGTGELPLESWFGKLGIGYRRRAAASPDDLGGYQPQPPSAPAPRALGARYEFQPAGLRITHVLSGSAAQRAGLAPGDLLVALDGERITQANLADLLRRAAGGEVEIHYFHRDRLTVSMLPLEPAPADTCDLWLLPSHELDVTISMRRSAWLRSARSMEA